MTVSLSVRGKAVQEAKAECEALLNEAMPFAQKMLGEHGECCRWRDRPCAINRAK
jgi:hypothetical protein